MIFADALSTSDWERAERTLAKLARFDISGWVLCGGFAVEQHIQWQKGMATVRPLHDVDFLVESFDDIPRNLGADFLIRHVHPDDPAGKTLMQLVDPETALRLDVFRAYGAVMDRALQIELGIAIRGIISLEDLTARAARLSWDLSGRAEVAPKYVTDFVRLLEVVNAADVDAVWREHRKGDIPERFSDAAIEIGRLIESRSSQLVAPTYSLDPNAVCDRCRETVAFKLADANRILAILGYC